MIDRRSLLANARVITSMAVLDGISTTPAMAAGTDAPWFSISLAEWSLNRALFSGGDITNLDFPVIARREFDIGVVEYVNQFFKDKAEDAAYLAELKQRCDDNGVKSGLIMVDAEGAIGDADTAARMKAVENHYKWVEAARFLGCHSIRVNAQSSGTWEQQLDYAGDGLRRLAEFGLQHGIDILVENHGGLSSHGKWLSLLIAQAGMPNVGTLPDFGNFTINEEERYDPYLGVQELMPFATGVSAKSYAFDSQGNETTIDYRRMLAIVRAAGFSGHIGIEFEGRDMDEFAGIRATKRLLERLRDEI